jgi:glutamate-ammonia-ligase adenylyltransferase
VAALSGYDRLPSFDAAVVRTVKAVNGRYGELFQDEEPLSSKFGSLVFTGVDDDPETLATLKRMGFSSPAQVSQAIRGWHHGRINATRTERGRELFTQLAPRLLDAAQATGAPDVAFNRFADFFTGLSSGVQLQSLFIAQTGLFDRLVELLAFAPKLARTLAQRPAAIDAMLDASFFDALEVEAGMTRAVADADGFEGAMDAVRRAHREQAFRIGAQVLGGEASAERAGGAFADLADLCIRTLGPAALAEVERIGGAFEGEVAVIALGKAGSREMSAGSDLDLMTLYKASNPAAMSALKGWGAETLYGRFTQRLVAALSAPTAEGTLYEVDLKLRPSGTQGPVAVSFAAFESYYAADAETWELLALTRARVVWSTSQGFAAEAAAGIEAALRRQHDRKKVARDTREMRKLMERERPPSGFWDLKLAEGGLVDIEFAAQFLQLAHAGQGGPLIPHTAEALAALAEAGLGPAGPLRALEQAWRLQQDLTQVIKVALAEGGDPDEEPAGFRRLLVRAGGARTWPALRTKLAAARVAAREAYDIVTKG